MRGSYASPRFDVLTGSLGFEEESATEGRRGEDSGIPGLGDAESVGDRFDLEVREDALNELGL